MVAEFSRFSAVQCGSPPPLVIGFTHVSSLTTYDEYLVIFINVQSSVGIDVVDLTIQYETLNILHIWLENAY